jgi:hypothetical protein
VFTGVFLKYEVQLSFDIRGFAYYESLSNRHFPFVFDLTAAVFHFMHLWFLNLCATEKSASTPIHVCWGKGV